METPDVIPDTTASIDQPCSFEHRAVSRWLKSLTAYEYDWDWDGDPVGYIRPDHLNMQTVAHLTLRFKDDVKVSGPITICAGRHYGLGLFAALDEHRTGGKDPEIHRGRHYERIPIHILRGH